MKVQCSCGAKYAFDVTPEMARTPIRFVCQSCGADSSDAVNQLIRQQLGATAEPPRPVAVPVAVVVRASAATPAPVAAMPAVSGPAPLKVAVHKAPSSLQDAAPASPEAQSCLKHGGQLATERCIVCQKPICPKCMELFGYVCSAFCKAKAENEKRDLPVYEHQRDRVEARAWRKVRLVATSIAAPIVVVLGVWFWYAWIGSMPKVKYSVKLDAVGRAGQCKLVLPDQAVFLRGGLLARHDLKSKKEVWSQTLVDFKDIPAEAAKQVAQMKAARDKAQATIEDGGDWQIPTVEEVAESIREMRAGEFELHTHGEHIWVATPEKLVQYDWQTGKAVKEIPLAAAHQFFSRGDELLLLATRESGAEVVTHIDMTSGETRTEEIAAPATQNKLLAAVDAKTAGSSAKSAATKTGVRATNQLANAGRPRGNTSGVSTGRPLGQPAGNTPSDPQVLARQAANMSTPQKLALPAVLAAQANQERALKEMKGEPRRPEATPSDDELHDSGGGRFILASGEFVQFEVKLIESKQIQRQTMKAAPAKSALDGEVNQAATAAIANELLNEMQRERTGGVTVEDVSRYQATLRAARGGSEWSGELIGYPSLHPLKTVNVVAGKKSLVVLDKSFKKLWESQLNFDLGGGGVEWDLGDERPGEGGPCVEHDESLYVFDEGVLTAFDRATGTVRWRFPSVGISGLFFDEAGAIYVNTSSGSPEKLQYSQQIDINDKIHDVVLKLDAKSGKGLWQVINSGRIAYVAGKFIYAVESYPGDDAPGLIGIQIPPHIRISRVDARDGRVLWEYYEKRYPIGLDFHQNTIQLLFRREMQIVKFLAL